MYGTDGSLCLVLHAHLPFVRHPEHPFFLEENWLFEAITECYLPLIDTFCSLLNDGIDFRINMSITPPLCEMLCDSLLRERYAARLGLLLELSEKELHRTRDQHEFHRTAVHYHQRLKRIRHLYEDVFRRDLVAAFRSIQDSGRLEIIASAATHGFLPLMQNRRAVRAQVRMGARNYRRHFGTDPRGVWLPECAYAPGLDAELAAEGLQYFFLDSHGVLFGSPRPKYGTFAPVCCRSRVAAFARDIESSKQVWSAHTGYPGDPEYREFYRDLGYDADAAYVAPYLHPDGIRHDLGLKYHRVTGDVPLSQKQPYDPDAARARTDLHAYDFVNNRIAQCRALHHLLGRKPLIVAPYDAELFGHWWYEGPEFLSRMIRKVAREQNAIGLVTAAGYLAENPTLQVIEPSTSSWGDKGYFEVWLNGSNDWIYRHLHKAEGHMCRLAEQHRTANVMRSRVLNQAARELMLAESSDWAFIMTTGTMAPYAESRVKTHIERFNRLHDMLESGAIDENLLSEYESRDNIFPDMDFRVYLE